MERVLKQQTVNGAIWSVASQGVTFVLGIISTGVLARLVFPEAYGLIAMVMVIIGLGELLRDFGLTNAVIQAPQVTEAEKSNLFWLNTSIGLLLSISVFLLATPIEKFYENESVGVVTRWLALTFLINGMATQPRANLVRDLRIRAVATIDILSNSIAVILAIAMALIGAQVWALVALKLCRDIVMLVASFVADGRIPRLPDRNADIRGFMHFGMLTFAARVPVYLSTNIGSALIGRHLNANVLGLYSRAQHLALLPTQQLTTPLSRVMLPTLSRLQNDTVEYNRWVTRTQSLMCLPIAVMYSFGIVFAHELVRVALGPSWDSVVPIFRILAIAGMIESSHVVTYWILVSKGLPKAHLQFSMITRPLLVAIMFIVAPHGVTAIAYAYSLWMVAAWVFGVFWVGRLAGVPSWSILQTGLRAYLLSVFLSATGMFAYGYFQASEHRVGLLATLFAMVAACVGVYLLSPGLRSDTLGIVALRHHVRR